MLLRVPACLRVGIWRLRRDVHHPALHNPERVFSLRRDGGGEAVLWLSFWFGRFSDKNVAGVGADV